MIHIVCESVEKIEAAKKLANTLDVICTEGYLDVFLRHLSRSKDVNYVVVFEDESTYLLVMDGKDKFRVEVDIGVNLVVVMASKLRRLLV